jgi:hypothetical protein
MFSFARAAPESSRPSDAEAVRAKLTACVAEIQKAEAELQQVSLRVALGSDDEAPAAEVLERLRRLRERRELLNAALAGAMQAEHDAAQAERSREIAARRRAASQHAARLEREARSVSEADLLTHFDAMVDASASLVASLPEHMRSRAEPWQDILSLDEMRQAVRIEGSRLERERRSILFGHQYGEIALEDRLTGALPTLTDRITKYTATIRDHLNPTAQPAPHTPLPEPRPASAPVSGDVSPSSSGAVPQRIGEVIDLRGRDLGKPASEASIEEGTMRQRGRGGRMTDTNPSANFAPPSLSPETVAYQQSLLADPAWCSTYPEYAKMLRATLDEALAATNYQPPPADPRAPAQRLHEGETARRLAVFAFLVRACSAVWKSSGTQSPSRVPEGDHVLAKHAELMPESG